MEINIHDLQTITEKLFLHLREINVEKVELAEDYYWEIPQEQLYNPRQEPSTFTLGQLSDDWDELVKLLNADSEPLACDLTNLAVILRAIGQSVLG